MIKFKLLVHKASFNLAVVEEITISFPASIAILKAFDKEPAYKVAPVIIISSVIIKPSYFSSFRKISIRICFDNEAGASVASIFGIDK